MSINTTIIKKHLIKWYDLNKRDLPWRNKIPNKTQDPYLVLVSEIMLQQTTVPTVIKRYQQFIDLWPTVNDLSKTSKSKILNFWSGLGYYNRALNLLKCSKIIKKKHKSKIPNNLIELINLPGIGKYTANAIRGIAFNESVMAIDANVERVITRINGISKPVSKIKKKIEFFSKKLIHKNRPGDMIQALMDFGSLICKPKNPVCNNCCINYYCVSFKKKQTHIIPVKNKIIKKSIKYASAYIILNKRNQILLKRRSSKGMLPSMLEIPTSEWLNAPLSKNEIEKYRPIKIKFKKINKNILYPFSHFFLKVNIYKAVTSKKHIKNGRWFSFEEIKSLGLPTIMKKIYRVFRT